MNALRAGRGVGGPTLAVLLVACAVAALLAWGVFARDARADDTAKPATAAAKAPPPEDIEALLLENPATLWALVFLKFAPATAGLVFALLWFLKRRDVARGLLPAAPPRPPPTSPFSLAWSLALFLGLLAAPSLLAVGFIQAGVFPKVETTKDLPIAWRIGLTAGVSLAMATAIVLRRRALMARGAPRPVPVLQALRSGGVAFCVFAALGIALGIAAKVVLTGVFHIEARAQDLVNVVIHPKHPSDPWLIAGFGVLVAPFVEECIHRGMMFASIRAKSGVALGVVVSSLVFAALHLEKVEDLHSFFPLLGLAALLAILYERTNSLLAVVTVHALNNATSLLPLLMLPAS